MYNVLLQSQTSKQNAIVCLDTKSVRVVVVYGGCGGGVCWLFPRSRGFRKNVRPFIPRLRVFFCFVFRLFVCWLVVFFFCLFFVCLFVSEVEISSRTLISLFRVGSDHNRRNVWRILCTPSAVNIHYFVLKFSSATYNFSFIHPINSTPGGGNIAGSLCCSMLVLFVFSFPLEGDPNSTCPL